ncbi:hypothetical protein FRC08_001152 [Ceratobasidium sp. 394]|nr:hypothetical protein FRC08_001152 [Ceratobasidium sp. 394]
MLSQTNNGYPYSTTSYTQVHSATQPAHNLSTELTWPNTQSPTPLLRHPLTKGSVANVLRRHSVAEEANCRFRDLQAFSNGTKAFELDVAYELQAALQAHIRELEDSVFGREADVPGPSTPAGHWY